MYGTVLNDCSSVNYFPSFILYLVINNPIFTVICNWYSIIMLFYVQYSTVHYTDRYMKISYGTSMLTNLWITIINRWVNIFFKYDSCVLYTIINFDIIFFFRFRWYQQRTVLVYCTLNAVTVKNLAAWFHNYNAVIIIFLYAYTSIYVLKHIDKWKFFYCYLHLVINQ